MELRTLMFGIGNRFHGYLDTCVNQRPGQDDTLAKRDNVVAVAVHNQKGRIILVDVSNWIGGFGQFFFLLN